MQHTLHAPVRLSGIGLHSGSHVTITLRPAPAGRGIVFRRTDAASGPVDVPALWDRVIDTRLCTVIGTPDGRVRIGTIEHLMSALRGAGVDNAVIEIDGPEVPVLDGSARPFLAAIESAGRVTQALPRRAIKVLKPVEVVRDGRSAALRPSNVPSFTGRIDFPHKMIGRQDFTVEMVNGRFASAVAAARTFGFLHEVEAMRRMGLARGGSLENAIVLDDTRILNEDGLRYDNEFVRHKVLDAVGDLYLAGGVIIGAYEGIRAGHELNNALLHALFADTAAWQYADLYADSMPRGHVRHQDRAHSGKPREIAVALA